MDLIKTGILGVIVGVYLSIIPLVALIPLIGPIIAGFGNACLCCLNPLILTVFGYVLCSFINIKKEDYTSFAKNIIVYSIVGIIIFSIVSFSIQLLGIGANIIDGGNNLTNVFLGALGGSFSTLLGIVGNYIMLLFFTLIGGVIYMLTKK